MVGLGLIKSIVSKADTTAHSSTKNDRAECAHNINRVHIETKTKSRAPQQTTPLFKHIQTFCTRVLMRFTTSHGTSQLGASEFWTDAPPEASATPPACTAPTERYWLEGTVRIPAPPPPEKKNVQLPHVATCLSADQSIESVPIAHVSKPSTTHVVALYVLQLRNPKYLQTLGVSLAWPTLPRTENVGKLQGQPHNTFSGMDPQEGHGSPVNPITKP